MFTSKQLQGEINHRTTAAASMMLKASRILKEISVKLTDPQLGDIPENFVSIAAFCEGEAKTLETKAGEFESPVIEKLQRRHELGTRRHKATLENRRYD